MQRKGSLDSDLSQNTEETDRSTGQDSMMDDDDEGEKAAFSSPSVLTRDQLDSAMADLALEGEEGIEGGYEVTSNEYEGPPITFTV